jgi:hypothetical protein
MLNGTEVRTNWNNTDVFTSPGFHPAGRNKELIEKHVIDYKIFVETGNETMARQVALDQIKSLNIELYML